MSVFIPPRSGCWRIVNLIAILCLFSQHFLWMMFLFAQISLGYSGYNCCREADSRRGEVVSSWTKNPRNSQSKVAWRAWAYSCSVSGIYWLSCTATEQVSLAPKRSHTLLAMTAPKLGLHLSDWYGRGSSNVRGLLREYVFIEFYFRQMLSVGAACSNSSVCRKVVLAGYS